MLPDLNEALPGDSISPDIPDLNEPAYDHDEINQDGVNGDNADLNEVVAELPYDEMSQDGLDHDNADGDAGDVTQMSNDLRRKFICDDMRRSIYSMLLQRTSPGKMKRGVTKSVAEEFGVSTRVVQRIWTTGKRGGGIHAVVNQKKGNVGRNRIYIDPQHIRDVSLSERTTLRDLARSLHVDPSTIFKRLKEGDLKRQTNDIKFSLTEENKKARVRFCISMLDRGSIPHDPIFRGMYDMVYIDEKWFYMTKKCQKYYLARCERNH